MLKIVHGDIFDPKFDKFPRVIAHGCNAQGVMGSGVAKEIKSRYPWAFEDYLNEYNSGEMKVGDVVWSCCTHGPTVIANCITQQYYGRLANRVYVDYMAVSKCMDELTQMMHAIEIHFPFIGGGLANGNRDLLFDIFHKAFQDRDATLFIKD